ncbi:MAG TPA: OmpA family protein [bacterium]|nr:OmpA family protein [bacterium]
MKKLFIVLVLLTAAGASSAWAIDVQNFQPAIGVDNLVTLYSSNVPAFGQFGFATTANFAQDPFIIEFAGNEEEYKIVEQMLTAELRGAIGLFNFAEFGFAGSYNSVSGKDMDLETGLDFPATGDESGAGLGDLRAAMKFRLLPNRPGSIGVALIGLGEFPSGDPDHYYGTEATNAGARLAVDKRFERVNIVVNGGYLYMGNRGDDENGFDPSGRAEVGAGVSIMAHKRLDLLAEIYGRTVDYQVENMDAEFPAEALLAVRAFAGPVHFTAGGGMGINAGIGNPVYRGFAGIGITWPEVAREHATLSTMVGADSRKDDSDRDGLTNYDETHLYKTDPADPDSDGDGLSDGIEVKQYGTDPTLDDSDGDGLSDAAEVRLYGTNPRQIDSDGDTLSDALEVGELRTNPLSVDSDEDQVPDNLDGAPLEPETINGYLDDDGVPEVVLARKPSGVMMFEGQFVLPAALTFDSPRGSNLSAYDKTMLADLAALLQEYPTVAVRIEGHVSAAVAEAQALSDARAQAVRNYLLSRKIDGARLTAEGMGDTVPIAADDTPAGQLQNTRVDLIIIKK